MIRGRGGDEEEGRGDEEEWGRGRDNGGVEEHRRRGDKGERG